MEYCYARTVTRLVLYSLIVFFGAGCSYFKPRERAPLEGGEQLEYTVILNGAKARAVLTLEKSDGGFIVKTNARGFGPQRVGPDLRDPFKPIAAFGLGHLWLPPSKREVGAKTYAAEVVREEASEGRTLLVLRATLLEHYFDKATGFLMAMKGLNDNALLVRTTVENLEPVKVPSFRKPIKGGSPAPGYPR